MDQEDDIMEAVAAAQAGRDAWSDCEYHNGDKLPVLTCGGVAVNYRVTRDGSLVFA